MRNIPPVGSQTKFRTAIGAAKLQSDGASHSGRVLHDDNVDAADADANDLVSANAVATSAISCSAK